MCREYLAFKAHMVRRFKQSFISVYVMRNGLAIASLGNLTELVLENVLVLDGRDVRP